MLTGRQFELLCNGSFNTLTTSCKIHECLAKMVLAACNKLQAYASEWVVFLVLSVLRLFWVNLLSTGEQLKRCKWSSPSPTRTQQHISFSIMVTYYWDRVLNYCWLTELWSRSGSEIWEEGFKGTSFLVFLSRQGKMKTGVGCQQDCHFSPQLILGQ